MVGMLGPRHANCVFDCSSAAADSLGPYWRRSKVRHAVSGIPHEEALTECATDEFSGVIKGLSDTASNFRSLPAREAAPDPLRTPGRDPPRLQFSGSC